MLTIAEVQAQEGYWQQLFTDVLVILIIQLMALAVIHTCS